MKGLRAGIIPCGTGTVDSNFMIAFDTVLTWDHPEIRPRWFRSPHTMVIIEHPSEGWILWDLGSRPDSAESPTGKVSGKSRTIRNSTTRKSGFPMIPVSLNCGKRCRSYIDGWLKRSRAISLRRWLLDGNNVKKILPKENLK